MFGKRVQSKRPVSVTLPASALPWPPMYLVSALTTRLAPTSSAGTATATSSCCRRRRGCRARGTARRCARGRPPACAGWRSSRRTRARVAGVIARLDLRRRRSRRRTTPACRAPPACSNRLDVLPNRNWLATTWSPPLSSASMIAPIAAMPVAKRDGARRRSSIALTLASSAADVGLPCRPYA